MFNPEFRVSINAGDGGKYYIGGLEYDSFRDSVGFLLFNEKGAKVFAKDGFRPLEQLHFSELSKVSEAARMSRTALNYSYVLYSRIASAVGVGNTDGLAIDNVVLSGNSYLDGEITSVSLNDNEELSANVQIMSQGDEDGKKEVETFPLALSNCPLETLALVSDSIARKYPEKQSLFKDESNEIIDRNDFVNDLCRFVSRVTDFSAGHEMPVSNITLSSGKEPVITLDAGTLKWDDEHGAVVYGTRKGEDGMEIVKMPVSELSFASLSALNDSLAVRYPSWGAYYGENCRNREKSLAVTSGKRAEVAKSQKTELKHRLQQAAKHSYSPSI